jgi:hypothetical protein
LVAAKASQAARKTEFMNAQLNSFNDQAKIIGEIYAKAAVAVAKTPSTTSV